jgi:hypothetical protein
MTIIYGHNNYHTTVFSTTWAGRGEVFSHHLPRGDPRLLDDDELCCISRRFSYRYYAKQKCEYCDKARIDRNCRQTPTVFLATDFHIAHDPNMHDVLVYYFGTSGSAAHAYGTFKLVNILSFLNFLTSLSSVRSGISNLWSYYSLIVCGTNRINRNTELPTLYNNKNQQQKLNRI